MGIRERRAWGIVLRDPSGNLDPGKGNDGLRMTNEKSAVTAPGFLRRCASLSGLCPDRRAKPSPRLRTSAQCCGDLKMMIRLLDVLPMLISHVHKGLDSMANGGISRR
jgi:hypothetical protein